LLPAFVILFIACCVALLCVHNNFGLFFKRKECKEKRKGPQRFSSLRLLSVLLCGLRG
jgi:hypothetical protein